MRSKSNLATNPLPFLGRVSGRVILPRRVLLAAFLFLALLSFSTIPSFGEEGKFHQLKADGTEVQWAHTSGDNAGVNYDIEQPIALKAPEGMTVELINKTERMIYDTGLNEVADVHKHLVEVGSRRGAGYAGLYYMSSGGSDWSHWSMTFVARAVKKPEGPISLKADGTEVQWAHTTGRTGSGIQYDIRQPVTLKAPEGMTIQLINNNKRNSCDTGLNEISDVHKYLVSQGDKDGAGFAGLFYMATGGHVWDYWQNSFVAKAVK